MVYVFMLSVSFQVRKEKSHFQAKQNGQMRNSER